jgi:membrane peptidoglycan carboxypeptidase
MLLAASVAGGVLLALIALPTIGSSGIATRNAVDNFMNTDPPKITRTPGLKTVVLDANGKPLVSFFEEYREELKDIKDVAPIMQEAMVAIEDSRFYKHGALDVKGTLAALVKNASSDSVQGGSTLTQQLAKNMLINNTTTEAGYKDATAGTASRKLRELRLALFLEQHNSKQQILLQYLNISNFGAGAYGIQAAAKRYFSKTASKLTLPEAALLAGITQNPVKYDPTTQPDKAIERRNVVIARMAQLGKITEAQAKTAESSKLKLHQFKPKGGCETSKSPYFCQYVYGDLIKIFMGGKKPKNEAERKTMQAAAREEILRGGYTIRTTIDPKMQKAAESGLKYGSYATPKGNKVAVEAMVEPGTGKIKAIAVSKKYGTDKGENTINLAADVDHGGSIYGIQSGSTFKAFTLLAALDQGIPIRTTFNSPSRIDISGFTDCNGGGTSPWNVGNAGDSESGPFNLKTGTWESVNTFYAALEKKVGLCDSVKMAEKFGMKKANGTPLDQVPSQVLGSNGGDMVHLAAAYAGIAARGKYCTPISVTSVIDQDGKKVPVPGADCEQKVDEQVADAATQILEGVLTGKGTAAGLGIGRPAAAKTGTCEEFSCAAFAGFTPNLASAVAYWDYRGNFKYKVPGIFGATVPGPIWEQSMIGALKDLPVLQFNAPTKDFGDVRTKAVPDVTGKSIPEAMGILKGAGFNVRVSPHKVKSDAPENSVAKISPSGEADEGSEITIYVSGGNGGKPGNGQGNNPPGWPFN